MNIFRLAGDTIHLLAIIILIQKIWTSRSCAGISGKSQILFALTYTARYMDLLTNFISVYNTSMKIIFVLLTYTTVYLIYLRFRATYGNYHDTFRIEYLLIPTVILSLLVTYDYSPLEILWTFSICLESVAILPQFFMVSKIGEAEKIVSLYLFALGSYRALYIFNWISRYYHEGFFDLVSIVAGVVQTVFYCIFFCLYITRDGELQRFPGPWEKSIDSLFHTWNLLSSRSSLKTTEISQANCKQGDLFLVTGDALQSFRDPQEKSTESFIPTGPTWNFLPSGGSLIATDLSQVNCNQDGLLPVTVHSTCSRSHLETSPRPMPHH